MLSADERLALLRVKIERAKKQFRDLASDILATERTTVVIDKGYERGQSTTNHGVIYSTELEWRRNVPRFSAEVLAGVGDIAHNLRTALDHLMCHLLTIAGSGITTRDCFPISKDNTSYEFRRAAIVNRVRPEVIEALDKLKPYKGGNDPLWRVHELNRIDKHRALFTFAHDFVLYADWLSDDFLFKRDAPDYAGLYDPEVEKEMQFEIEKSLSKPQVPGRDAVLPSIHQLIDVVEDVIFGFKPFLE